MLWSTDPSLCYGRCKLWIDCDVIAMTACKESLNPIFWTTAAFVTPMSDLYGI